MIRRVLVANRGAIARRVVRACNALGIESVAVYSEADARAPYLEEATQALPLQGVEPTDTYLNQQKLLELLVHTQCDAVHPGYGFLAENAEFAQGVVASGAVFVGPSPEHLQLLGDKVTARLTFADAGFPVHAGSELLHGVESARTAAAATGYPILLKPVAGGGGIGMQRVVDETALEAAFRRASALSDAAFGSDGIYLERWLDKPRHIEIQVLVDAYGRGMHFFERDCSIQRRNQKVVEESPAPHLDAAELERVTVKAVQTLEKLGYVGLATVEMLYEPELGQYGFLEVNPRIQVEHAVTEQALGVDLVRAQLLIAAGAKLEDLQLRAARGQHAVEVRIYAEHPTTQRPSTGRLSQFALPTKMHGVRAETGYRTGMFVTPFYDPLLGKLIANGDTREQAIGRALVAVKATEISGVDTNCDQLEQILTDPRFLAGQVHTQFLD